MKLGFNDHYRELLCPFSTLGVGKAGLVKKSINVARLTVMHSENWDEFHVRRTRKRGTCTDGGTEKDLSTITVDMLPKFAGKYHVENTERYMYPNAIAVIGCLHPLWGGLEVFFKSSPFDFLVRRCDHFIAKFHERQIVDEEVPGNLLRDLSSR